MLTFLFYHFTKDISNVICDNVGIKFSERADSINEQEFMFVEKLKT